VPLVILFVLSFDVVDVPLTVVPVESLSRVSPLVPSPLLFCVDVLLNPLPDPPSARVLSPATLIAFLVEFLFLVVVESVEACCQLSSSSSWL
jgi:hypothetical protein